MHKHSFLIITLCISLILLFLSCTSHSKIRLGDTDDFSSFKPNTLLSEEDKFTIRTQQYTDVETLIVSGSLDCVTPAEHVQDKMLIYFTNGTHIVIAEFGHEFDPNDIGFYKFKV